MATLKKNTEKHFHLFIVGLYFVKQKGLGRISG